MGHGGGDQFSDDRRTSRGAIADSKPEKPAAHIWTCQKVIEWLFCVVYMKLETGV